MLVKTTNYKVKIKKEINYYCHHREETNKRSDTAMITLTALMCTTRNLYKTDHLQEPVFYPIISINFSVGLALLNICVAQV